MGHEQLSRRQTLLRNEWELALSCTRWLTIHFRDCETSTNGHLRSYGGREASLEAKAKAEADQIARDGKSIAGDAKAGAENILGDVKQKAAEVKQKVGK